MSRPTLIRTSPSRLCRLRAPCPLLCRRASPSLCPLCERSHQGGARCRARLCPRGQVADYLEEPVYLRLGESGGRLVQDQDPRLRGRGLASRRAAGGHGEDGDEPAGARFIPTRSKSSRPSRLSSPRSTNPKRPGSRNMNRFPQRLSRGRGRTLDRPSPPPETGRAWGRETPPALRQLYLPAVGTLYLREELPQSGLARPVLPGENCTSPGRISRSTPSTAGTPGTAWKHLNRTNGSLVSGDNLSPLLNTRQAPGRG